MPKGYPSKPCWKTMPASVKFFLRVDTHGENGCWLWTGAKNANGYGSFGYTTKKTKLAHRYSYEILRGPIEAQTLDHLCRVRACVNPDHLEPCSLNENIDRSPVHNRHKQHCKNGHPLSGPNLLIEGGTTARRCRICRSGHKGRN